MVEERRTSTGALRTLQVLLWFVCVSHILLGGAIMLSSPFQQTAARLYGAQIEWTPQFAYILRPLGAFMLVLGLVGIAAALDPVRYRPLVYGFGILLLIRVAQRLVFRQEIADTFAIEPVRNAFNAGFFLVLALALILLGTLVGKRQPPQIA